MIFCWIQKPEVFTRWSLIKLILLLIINHENKCYLCFIYIFLLDPECFKIKTKLNSSFDITAPLTQSNDSNNKTSSDVSLYINTTAGTTSDLQHVINNGNKIGHGKDSTNVIHIVFNIGIGLVLFHSAYIDLWSLCFFWENVHVKYN